MGADYSDRRGSTEEPPQILAIPFERQARCIRMHVLSSEIHLRPGVHAEDITDTAEGLLDVRSQSRWSPTFKPWQTMAGATMTTPVRLQHSRGALAKAGLSATATTKS